MRYAIKDTYTNEFLVDNLTLNKVTKQLKVYKNLYGDHLVITVCGYEPIPKYISRAEEYKQEYINYFNELQQMGNLI